jgi:hypothetical protein
MEYMLGFGLFPDRQQMGRSKPVKTAEMVGYRLSQKAYPGAQLERVAKVWGGKLSGLFAEENRIRLVLFRIRKRVIFGSKVSSRRRPCIQIQRNGDGSVSGCSC